MNGTNLPICGSCGKTAQQPDAAFCPYCGHALNAPLQPQPPRGAMDAIAQANLQKDPKKKWEILSKAESEYPDCLEIAEELLFLGRLHERNPKKPDMSVIKCYLFQIYLTPKELSADQITRMRNELFTHPQLQRCQALAADPSKFTSRYLTRLAGEFVELFLRGSNQYMQSIFGFTMGSKAPKLLANPTADMMCQIRRDMELTADERDMLYTSLYQGFDRQMSGDTTWLDQLLRADGNPVPQKA